MKKLIIDHNTDISQKSKFHIVPTNLLNGCDKHSDVQVSNYFESTFKTVDNITT
jgi:hypothetical protein